MVTHSCSRQDYYFEEVQNVRVVVYDEDKKGSQNLKHHDMQGEVTFTVAQLMCGHTTRTHASANSAPGTHTHTCARTHMIALRAFISRCGDNETITNPLLKKGKAGNGTLTIRGEEMASCSEHLRFQLAGKKLPNKVWGGVVRCAALLFQPYM